MKSIDQLTLKGKKVLVRVDFNVPLNAAFEVTDDTRLRAAIPTIQKITAEGASVILMSHLGRPKDGPTDKYSLRHIVKPLEVLLDTSVQFANDCIGNEAIDMSNHLKSGEILLLENLRFYPEEEKGDIDFARKLSLLGDVYVNDAFGTAHRAHASTSIIAQFFSEKAAGYVMKAELDNAKKVLNTAQKPYVAIMGGAKISDKILIIEQLLNKVDTLIIGGGMAYTFFKAMGGSIGNSLLEADKVDLALSLMEKATAKGVKLLLPPDSVASDKFANDGNRKICSNMEIPDGFMGLDIGPEAIDLFSAALQGAKTILWNGPMGVFELTNFAAGTEAVANAVVKATEEGGYSLIGGGDSAAAVSSLGFSDRVSYVSTGGGALLEYMEGKVLPGVAALV